MTGFNNATAYTLKNAVSGNYPNFEVNYSMALVSRGDLPNALSPQATSTPPGKITFTWGNNSGMGKASPTDKSILVAYSTDLNQCIYSLNGPVRSEASAVLEVPLFMGQVVQTYIGFISADGKDISNSFFTGAISLPS
jgi:hypothetical protein